MMFWDVAKVCVFCTINMYAVECLVLWWPCSFCNNANMCFNEEGNKSLINDSTF